MAKIVEKFLSKGKVYLVRASRGRDVAMKMTGKWKGVCDKVGFHEKTINIFSCKVLDGKDSGEVFAKRKGFLGESLWGY